MNFQEIKKNSSAFRPAISLEKIITNKTLAKYNSLFFILTLLFFAFSLTFYLFGGLLPATIIGLEYKVYGVLATTLAIWSFSFALYSFSNYFRFLDIVSVKKREQQGIKISFELAEVVQNTNTDDLVIGFLNSDFGEEVIIRSGLKDERVENFLSSRSQTTETLTPTSFPIVDKTFLNVFDYVEALFHNDRNFNDFVFKNSLQETEFLGTVRWLNDIFIKTRRKERWWSQENLSKIEPIGTDWSYGVAYELEKFSNPIEKLIDMTDSLQNFHQKEIEEMEIILSRTEEANAILIGEAGTGKLAVVAGLAEKIKSGKALENLSHKKILVLDTGTLIATTGEKNSFEQELLTIMNQTAKSGNLIMVIDNLPFLIQNANSFGTDIVSLLDNYLGSSNINILALSDKNNFHNLLEPNSALMNRFEYVILDKIKEESILAVLEEKLLALEYQNKVMFTFPALINIVYSATRYFPGGVMPDKAIDLLLEIIPYTLSKGENVIKKSAVEDFVRKKTGIPIGTVTEEEKGVLSNLEEILHKRVVGQNQAIEVISNALRRARSGISNPERPLGSFLFLGPTGVGKTETSKALAEVFFENDKNISRLDMSEYQGADALNRLIGSFDSNKAGNLASMLREKPYSVLLLDEFEKADHDVHNLFLQILDEGIFTDSSGKEVNSKNSIIIATSNAGSELIWEYEKTGENLKEKTPEIINYIISKGMFSPELLNRFDGVIVFHSLDRAHLRKVADLQINKLKERVRQKGLEIKVSEDVINHLIETGTDRKFGARALNRAVQENLEKAIAEKIINETPASGTTLIISIKDIGV